MNRFIQTRENILLNLESAKRELARREAELAAWDQDPKNNVFESLEDAERELYEILSDRASLDCVGSYNCGADEYRQGFFVGDKEYVAIADVEYNRHDKQYYFIDGYTFNIEEVK